MNIPGKVLATLLLVSTSACTSNPAGEAAEAAAGSAAGSRTNVTGGVDISSAKADPDTWMSFSADEHRFEARFPLAPKKQDMSVPTPLGTIPAMVYMAEQDDDAVAVTVLTVPESMLSQFNVDGGLDGARDGMINNVGGTIVSETLLPFRGHAAGARGATAAAGNKTMRVEARLFWVSPRMYQLLAVSVEGSATNQADKFFDNFRLLD
jgi:hypothetical protein